VSEYEKMMVEKVFEEIIEFPALVKAKKDRLVVTFLRQLQTEAQECCGGADARTGREGNERAHTVAGE
jgi:hypothetical protein